MTSLTLAIFNPLTFAHRLKQAGVPDQQADVEAEVLHEALAQQAQIVSALGNKVSALQETTRHAAEQMATKADIAALKADIALLDAKITIARRDTIIWLGGMLIAGFGSVITLLLRFSG